MPTLQENRYETLGNFPKLKMTYEKIAVSKKSDVYKCVLRYEGRQYTTTSEVLHGNRTLL